MTINGRRNFKHNGNRYCVQDAIGKDREKGKYYLTIIDGNGFNKVVYDCLYDMLFFATIKDAQRAVLYQGDMLTVD